MPRAKRADPVSDEPEDEHLDQPTETDTLSGAIPEGEAVLGQSVAKRLGWRPKEEWTRDPDKFVDWPDFLENTPKVIAELKEQGERQARAAAAAIEEAQREKVERATRVIRESDDPAAREAAAKELQGPPPETRAWLAKNPWFDTDSRAQALAVSTVNDMAKRGASISVQLEEAESEVRKRFPEYFATGVEQRLSDVRRQATTPPQVQQGSRATTTQSTEKGFAQIPRKDREAFELHLLKPMLSMGKTKEQAEAGYAKRYWGAGTLPPEERGDDPWVNQKKSNPWGRR